MHKTAIGILASTRATDLEGVVKAIAAGELRAHVAVLISNKKDAYCLERAKLHGIPGVFLNPKEFSSREEFDRAIAGELEKRHVAYVVCIGYMLLFSPWFVREYRNKIINIHPSLLPDFPGMDLNVHQAVLDARVKVTGCTAHLIDEGIDTGKIIVQKKVPVLSGDTPESLKERVQAAEQTVLPRAIQMVIDGNG